MDESKIPKPCVWCDGTGYIKLTNILCRTCNGTGKIKVDGLAKAERS